MGFFSDLKEDLAQAVNELTEDNAEKELLEEEERLKTELSELEEEFTVNGVEEDVLSEEEEYAHYMAEEAVFVEDALEEDVDDDNVNEDVMAALSEGYAGIADNLPDTEGESLIEEFEAAVTDLDMTIADEVEEIEEIEEVTDMLEETTMVDMMEEEVFEDMSDANTEVGTIPVGMIITGDISTSGGLDLKGTVLGNIEIGGKLNVSGSIQGNSKALEIYAQAAKITGDVNCDNSVKIGPNSVVIGNISARSAVIAGAVKGDIDVRGPVILDSSAIIMGNIKSKSVQINNGAAIEGMCSQCYADINPSSFFDGIDK